MILHKSSRRVSELSKAFYYLSHRRIEDLECKFDDLVKQYKSPCYGDNPLCQWQQITNEKAIENTNAKLNTNAIVNYHAKRITNTEAKQIQICVEDRQWHYSSANAKTNVKVNAIVNTNANTHTDAKAKTKANRQMQLFMLYIFQIHM